MIGSQNAAALQSYVELGIESEIESASPHRIVQLMMAGAITRIGTADKAIESGDIPAKGKHIGDAISIINGLQSCLNYKVEESLAGNFDALYDYMIRRLLAANIDNDREMLAEVSGLMRELKEAWDAIEGQAVEQR